MLDHRGYPAPVDAALCRYSKEHILNNKPCFWSSFKKKISNLRKKISDHLSHESRKPKLLFGFIAGVFNWLAYSEKRQPWKFYADTGTVGAIAFFGTVSTFAMAYGFSEYKFDFTEAAIRYWLVVLALVFVSIGLQVMREKALKRKTDLAEEKYLDAQRSLIAKTNNLDRVLRTMPPPHALSTFTESYKATLFQWRFRKVADRNSPQAKKDEAIAFYERTIRFSLNAVAQLFLHYEHKPLDTKCSAHLSRFVTMRDLRKNKALRDRVKREILFVDDRRRPLQGLKGILHIDPALSTYAAPGMETQDKKEVGAEQDPKLTDDLFLPVPDCDDEDPNSPRSRAIPIAPRAFQFGQVIYDRVRDQITKDASENWNVTPKVIDEVLAYIEGQGQGDIGSAVAFRLLWEYQGKEGESPDLSKFAKLGVLTIMTEAQANMSEDVVDAYYDLIRPIVELQKELLLAIMELRS
jgi:hypothetical protein